MTMRRQTRLGLIGLGEVGNGLARGLRAEGLAHMCAYDPGAMNGPFAELIQSNARAAGIDLVPSLAALAARSDTIISSTPGRQSIPSAEAIAPYLNSGHLYVDLASATPKIKTAALELAAAAGARIADGAIGGSPLIDGHRIEILVCGPDGEDVRDILVPWGMNITHVGPKLGTASGIKIFRSVIAKGLEAVIVECIMAAEQHGISEEVLASYTRFFSRPFGEMAKYMLTTNVIHAQRRAEEAEMSAEALRDTGIEPIMTEATVARLQSIADLGLKTVFAGKPPTSYDAAVAAIVTRLYPDAAVQ
ncbi:DUF1932 domain-containing protein [Aquabacter sp. CN5-332]|uniref:DUF1932 domain-containing protein n=1 Tax=Aquabacter sp. CN5-332 TaxID=3156608 RepID=UPI0032B3BA29